MTRCVLLGVEGGDLSIDASLSSSGVVTTLGSASTTGCVVAARGGLALLLLHGQRATSDDDRVGGDLLKDRVDVGGFGVVVNVRELGADRQAKYLAESAERGLKNFGGGIRQVRDVQSARCMQQTMEGNVRNNLEKQATRPSLRK